ncbi:MAG: hypothetical protein IH897_05855 [Planctomycetes bacterium]|nr:hypothetical protein [Planctomycetota bacterium]
MFKWCGPLVIVLSGSALAICGCGPRLPVYPWRGHDLALRTIVHRAELLETLTAECRLILTRPDGTSTQLSGALVARMPGYFRLRAWKLSQPVFDVTLTPQGLWIFAADLTGGDPLQSLPAERIVDAWSILSAGIVNSSWDPVPDLERRRFRVGKDISSSDTPTNCAIDRSTFTIRECEFVAGEDDGNLALRMDRYKVIDGHVWPLRIEALSDHGRVTLLLDDVSINGEITEGAFQPPRRAIKKR